MTDARIHAAPQPARRGNLGDTLVEKLKSAIQQGTYAPGQRLIEADLMIDLGAGRGPVREALRRLGTLGIVELIPNRGAFVTRFSDRDLFDLFRVREGLEGWAARLTAERVRSGSERERFVAALAAARRADITDPARRFREENRVFHDLIIETADNAFLVAAIDRLKIPAARLHLRAATHDDYRDASEGEHQAVVQAVLRGDPDAAEQAMRQHLSRARTRIFDQLAEPPVAAAADGDAGMARAARPTGAGSAGSTTEAKGANGAKGAKRAKGARVTKGASADGRQ